VSENTSSTAVTDLLGMLAYACLLAFDRMAADTRLAPDLHRRAILSEMAAAQIANYRRIADRLAIRGVDPAEAMLPFLDALSGYHEATEPTDWLEALTKAYIGDGLAGDFYRSIAAHLPDPERDLVLHAQQQNLYDAFAVDEIRAAIAADPKVAGRLSMWARRLVGEALSQATRVISEHGRMLALVGDADLGDDFFARLKQAHGDRMAAVGLNN
jgi:hypothetical protein